MIEPSEDEKRLTFFSLYHSDRIMSRKMCEAVTWAQNRLRELELENENLRKTTPAISNSPPAEYPESDEEVHQRRRRERMLDEITLICVRDQINKLPADMEIECQNWGCKSRKQADNIFRGIKEYDAQN